MADATSGIKLPKGVDQAEVDRALDLLKRTREQRDKQRDKMKNDPVQRTKMAERALKLRVKNSLLTKKALLAGITVSDAEVSKAIADLKGKV